MQGRKYTPELLLERINKLEDGCWIWNGATDSDGYGKTWWQGQKNTFVHRIAYELWVGPIEHGKLVLHKCDVPACCNPNHLWQGTQKDNMQDALKKGRKYKGMKNPNAKLTDYQVLAMRQMYTTGVSINRLSLLFNVSRRTAHNVVHGKSWEHLRAEAEVV